jgi:uncharacterized protein (DUF1778 family)
MPTTRKSLQLQIRVSPEQKAAIKSRAKKAEMSMSDWVMSTLLPGHRTTFQELVSELATSATSEKSSFVFAELLELLGGLSAHEFDQAVSEAPRVTLEPYWAGYVASTIEHTAALNNTRPPTWARDVPPLEEPSFGSTLLSVREYLLTRSPPAFSRRNIFIDASVGDRV